MTVQGAHIYDGPGSPEMTVQGVHFSQSAVFYNSEFQKSMPLQYRITTDGVRNPVIRGRFLRYIYINRWDEQKSHTPLVF